MISKTSDNNATIRFAIEHYFDGNVSQAADRTGYTQAQIKRWIKDEITPRLVTVRYFMLVALIPEFKIVCEHHPYDYKQSMTEQLKKMLNGHHDAPGIYVFYDSLCEPIYLGKANSSLKTEITSALNRSVSLSYPKSISSPPKKVKELVAYISAYDVAGKEHSDYPKHVESLILRINKPKLNKQSGSLTKVIPIKPELKD